MKPELPFISRKMPIINANPISLDNATVSHLVVRLVRRHGEAEHCLRPCRSLLPATPDQMALSSVKQRHAQNGAKLSRCGQPLRPRLSGFRMNLLAALAVKHGRAI